MQAATSRVCTDHPRMSTRLPTAVRTFVTTPSGKDGTLAKLPDFHSIRAACKPLTYRSTNPEHAVMQDRIRHSLDDRITFDHYVPALNRMLTYIGLEESRSPAMCSFILSNLVDNRPLNLIERQLHQTLQHTIVDPSTNCSFIDAIGPKLAGRGQLIFQQIEPHLRDMHGKEILDFGAGGGLVTAEIRSKVSPHTVGIDVRPYGDGIIQYDGRHAPFANDSFDCIVVTNVFHHEKNNQQCLDEVHRLLKPGGKLIVVETVPTGSTEEEAQQDLGRTFLVDFTYNRLFNDADIPVPGTFETAIGWTRRFAASGFEKPGVVEHLGFDQEIVPDWHVLYVVHKPVR
jgi:SAM-dependent methyltransferase